MLETTITKNILKYLNGLPNTYAFKIHGAGYGTNGVSAIMCCHEGRFVAMEVKVPTRNRPTKMQKYFLKRINEAHGQGAVVTSILDVINILSPIPTEYAKNTINLLNLR